MLEKQEFLKRHKEIKEFYEERKHSATSDDWETSFASDRHFPFYIPSLLRRVFNVDPKSYPTIRAIETVFLQLIQGTYFYDHKKYSEVVSNLEELLLLPPNIKKENFELIKKYLHKDAVVLEFGSGYSTLAIAKEVKHIYSVENRLYWFSLITILHEILQITNVTMALYASDNTVSEQQFRAATEYVMFPQRVKDNYGCEKYDVVIVDGALRGRCLEAAYPFMHENSVAIVDNYERDKEEYAGCIDLYEEVERSIDGDVLVVLKPKGI